MWFWRRETQSSDSCVDLSPPSVGRQPGSHTHTCSSQTPSTALCRSLWQASKHQINMKQQELKIWPLAAKKKILSLSTKSDVNIRVYCFDSPATLVLICMFSCRLAKGSRYSWAQPAMTSCSLMSTWLRRSLYNLNIENTRRHIDAKTYYLSIKAEQLENILRCSKTEERCRNLSVVCRITKLCPRFWEEDAAARLQQESCYLMQQPSWKHY